MRQANHISFNFLFLAFNRGCLATVEFSGFSLAIRNAGTVFNSQTSNKYLCTICFENLKTQKIELYTNNI